VQISKILATPNFLSGILQVTLRLGKSRARETVLMRVSLAARQLTKRGELDCVLERALLKELTLALSIIATVGNVCINDCNVRIRAA
jgi:hypothetical protein